jgi:hypothetical protein
VAPDTAIDDVAGRSVVRSVFALLRELREETGPVGVSTLARRTGMPKSTVQRLLMQMAAEEARSNGWAGHGPWAAPWGSPVRARDRCPG